MLQLISNFIKKERSYFDKLDKNGKNLFKSFALAGVADPILYTFVNAFLWRNSSGDLTTVALYNLGFYIGLPISFYLNGLLLKWFKANRLYVFGCISQGVVVSILIFLSISTTWQIWLFGVLYGLGSGFFWANRNFLTLRVTKTDNRMYFSSLESLSGTLNSVVVPFIVGWFIVSGEIFNLYTTQQGYELLSLAALVVLITVGYFMRHVDVEVKDIERITLSKASTPWNRMRFFNFLDGLVNGINLFLPVIILLHFTQSEGAVGTVQSFAEIGSAIIVYYFSRFISVHHRFSVFFIGFLLCFIGTLVYSATFSSLGVIALFAGTAMGQPFQWTAISSVGYDMIDQEERNHPSHHYAFVFDAEVFLNFGRYLAVFLFLLCINFFSFNAVLRFTPLVFITMQLVQLLIIRSIDPHHHNEPRTDYKSLNPI